jgi:dTDP-4-amino-4,6-dideoxygalactose transaminase
MLSGIHADFPLQKFPLFIGSAQSIRAILKKENMHLDDGWTNCVVCPDSVSLPDAGYEWGADPKAEAACKQILSLPTHPTMTLMQAETLSRRLDTLLKHSESTLH